MKIEIVALSFAVIVAAISAAVISTSAPTYTPAYKDDAILYVKQGVDVLELNKVPIRRFNGWIYSEGCVLRVNNNFAIATPESCIKLFDQTVAQFDKVYPSKPREFIINGVNVGECSNNQPPRCRNRSN